MLLKMSKDSPWQEMIERAHNFRWNISLLEEYVQREPKHFILLHNLQKQVVILGNTCFSSWKSNTEKVKYLFGRMYHTLSAQRPEYELFSHNPQMGEDVFDACFFTTLCSFLNASKRIKGKSLRDFVLENHPNEFLIPDSPFYRNPLEVDRAIDRLRTSRNRLLSRGEVYYKNSQWQAITKDMEYEWALYFEIDDYGIDVKDTFKRFGVLYNDIDKVIDNEKNDEYKEKLKEAYKKFRSKVEKIKYENFLKLCKIILDRIEKNKEHYGINIYRLERKLKPYIITQEVKKLLDSEFIDDERDFLEKTVILKDIMFPKLYTDFISLPFQHMEFYAMEFPGFLTDIVGESCLILDALVEKGIFGEEWEKVFLDVTNDMVESVFYKPSEIDFTISPGSQEKFERLLLNPVLEVLCYEGNMSPSDFGEEWQMPADSFARQ